MTRHSKGALGSCWQCLRFNPFSKQDVKRNFGCPGGCSGNGIQTEEEASTPFRECYQAKPDYSYWQYKNFLHHNDDYWNDREKALTCQKCKFSFLENGYRFCSLIKRETDTDGRIYGDGMVCDRFIRR